MQQPHQFFQQFCKQEKGEEGQKKRSEGIQVLSNMYNVVPKDLPNNPRYFFIKIVDFQKSPNDDTDIFSQIDKLRIDFTMADKISHSQFNFHNAKINEKELQRIRGETHLFCYQAEQILNIAVLNPKFQDFEKENQNEKDKDKTKTKQKKQKQAKQQNSKNTKHKQKIYTFDTKMLGHSKVLVTPFVVLPYTRHKVDVDIILYNQSPNYSGKSVTIAVLKLQIFYLLDFEAQIQIAPLYAQFTKNAGLIGTMRPCCILTLNQQRKKSILSEQGGIYPRWEKQAKISQQLKKRRNIDEQGWNAEIFDTKYSEQAINNRFKFKLTSVGHSLKISIVNFPFFDKDAEVIGETQIRIQSRNMLKLPYQQIKHENQTAIRLHIHNPITKQKQSVGKIALQTKFIFNADQIIKDITDDEDKEELIIKADNIKKL